MTLLDLPFGLGIRAALWLRRLHQRRRRVKLTVHRADLLGPFAMIDGKTVVESRVDSFFITVTNASHDRAIEVTHVWLETTPAVHVHDVGLPVRLEHSARWETFVPVAEVAPADIEQVPWLARCVLAPDDKVVKSQPRKNVPPFGAVPRGQLPRKSVTPRQ